MKSNKITVKEFQRIDEELLKNNDPDYTDEFQELIDFIDEFNNIPDNADAYSLLSVKKDKKGKYVQIKNYVGLIELKSGYQIEILPKIDMADNDEDIKKIFIKMLRSMKDFEGKSFNMANLNVSKMNLYEIFINFYLQETDKLVKKGLKSDYISNEDNLNVLKGKLLFKEQIKYNTAHKEKFYVKYDEYQLNRPENKLIKSTLLELLNITNSMLNKTLCRQLLSHFENVDVSNNYDADFSKIKSDRNTKDYDMLMQWSKVILKKKSFTTFSGPSKSKALLFPMEKLFESYVAKYMIQVYEGTGIDVSKQDQGYYLFDEPSKEFSLRPDIVITKEDGTKVILDTKWKELSNEPGKNYGIQQSDMYQMYAYSKKYGKNEYNPEVFLLYPLNNEMRNHSPIDYNDDDGVKVHIRFIDLVNDIIDELNKLKPEIEGINI